MDYKWITSSSIRCLIIIINKTTLIFMSHAFTNPSKTPQMFSQNFHNNCWNTLSFKISFKYLSKQTVLFHYGCASMTVDLSTSMYFSLQASITASRFASHLCNKTWQAQFSQSWPTLLMEDTFFFQNRSQQSTMTPYPWHLIFRYFEIWAADKLVSNILQWIWFWETLINKYNI